jgi:hypothetical protein
MELLGKRCQNCKSVALLDERYQVVCTECGLCDSLESVPNIDSVTQLVGAIRVSTVPTTTQLEMVDEERRHRNVSTGPSRIPFKKREIDTPVYLIITSTRVIICP